MKEYNPNPPQTTFSEPELNKFYGAKDSDNNKFFITEDVQIFKFVVVNKNLRNLNASYRDRHLGDLVSMLYNKQYKIYEFDTAKELYLWLAE